MVEPVINKRVIKAAKEKLEVGKARKVVTASVDESKYLELKKHCASSGWKIGEVLDALIAAYLDDQLEPKKK